MKVIFDSNIWISFLIGHHAKLLQGILTDSRCKVVACDELLEEIRGVCLRSKICSRVCDEEVDDLFRVIFAYCAKVKIEIEAVAKIRDPKDLYLLSLAETVNANYIVTGDNDVLDLKWHKQTKMLTFAEFKALI